MTRVSQFFALALPSAVCTGARGAGMGSTEGQDMTLWASGNLALGEAESNTMDQKHPTFFIMNTWV